ncbi:MAG: CZB domain-containing protein [Proteobacteria bacterium]|nr:CZB domain-containing protein [Pseudomonadota bacterium]
MGINDSTQILNIDEAIKAHSDWKIKLQRFLKNPDGSIDSTTVAKDNVCPLGKWMHFGNDSNFKKFTEFNELIIEHKRFHLAAAEIINRKNRGEDVTESIALGGNSEFSKASQNVIGLLMKLKRHMNSGS